MTEDPGTQPNERWTRAAQRYQAWKGQPTWLQRALVGVVLVVLLGLAVILFVASFVIGAVIAGLAAIAIGVATLIRRLKGGTGSKGRENVRVIVRQ